jgi:hypothetical protein
MSGYGSSSRGTEGGEGGFSHDYVRLDSETETPRNTGGRSGGGSRGGYGGGYGGGSSGYVSGIPRAPNRRGGDLHMNVQSTHSLTRPPPFRLSSILPMVSHFLPISGPSYVT